MPTNCGLALLGPGLDGQIALELVRRSGCEVHAATFATPFTAYYEAVCAAAQRLAVSLHTLHSDHAYLERVAHPRFGYARELAPCLDCKVAMLRAAHQRMSEVGATFLVTGDVVGQRMPGQCKRDLALVDFHAGVEGLVLRPLSAQLLAPTLAETAAAVQREAMLDINGRSRQRQLALAREWGWQELPAVTSGCLLADAAYARRFRDALEHDAAWSAALAVMHVGRHFRLSDRGKAIVGRNGADNVALQAEFERDSQARALLVPHGFVGPTALVLGGLSTADLALASQLVLRYAKRPTAQPAHLLLRTAAGASEIEIYPEWEPALPDPL